MKRIPTSEKFKPGKQCAETGLYLCEGCREIIALSKGERFPPCKCGAVNWILVAIAGEPEKYMKSG
ncbi:MAG: hypothetical protein Q6363_004990 [Candidatus Njordarchaeota archaeon]